MPLLHISRQLAGQPSKSTEMPLLHISRQLAGQPSKSTEMPLLHQQAARWSTIQVNRYALITYQQAARWSTIQVNRNALITSAGSSLVNHPSQPKCPYYISRQLAGQPSKSTEMPLLHQQAARWSTIQVNRSDGFQP